MLCAEDAVDGLRWAESVGGLKGMIARSEASLAAVSARVAASDWAGFLAEVPAQRSCTSICLNFTTLAAELQADVAKKMAALLEKQGVAFDIGGYRDAPPGLRIWAGATVEPADVAALLPWLDWAYATVTAEG